MNERRDFYRVRCFARVGLRVIDAERERAIRLQIRARNTPGALAPGPFEDSRLEIEQRAIIELLQRISFSLNRIEHRLEDIALRQQGGEAWFPVASAPVEISLSGGGFSGRFEADLPAGALVEATLDIWEAGLPLIYGLARVIGTQEDGQVTVTALRFEELTPEDLERIVQFTIQTQSKVLRDRHTEGS